MNSKEALEKLSNNWNFSFEFLQENKYGFIVECYNIIKQDLDRLEKLEKENLVLLVNKNAAQCIAKKFKEENDKLKKVIEILKDKQVHIITLLECIKANGGVELYNACVEKPFRLTQEQYNLLKEVLEND